MANMWEEIIVNASAYDVMQFEIRGIMSAASWSLFPTYMQFPFQIYDYVLVLL